MRILLHLDYSLDVTDEETKITIKKVLLKLLGRYKFSPKGVCVRTGIVGISQDSIQLPYSASKIPLSNLKLANIILIEYRALYCSHGVRSLLSLLCVLKKALGNNREHSGALGVRSWTARLLLTCLLTDAPLDHAHSWTDSRDAVLRPVCHMCLRVHTTKHKSYKL
ncbi:hypothetical protein J6590_034391 [Homalodisca vitripennis]|nr:hypothetical protein J6590_034391 [Homalodisca vitripennis]